MARAKLPPTPLKVFSFNGLTAILDANGDEVVSWMGFDDSSRTRAEHNLLARELVAHFNASTEPAQNMDLVDCGECRTQGCPAGKCRNSSFTAGAVVATGAELGTTESGVVTPQGLFADQPPHSPRADSTAGVQTTHELKESDRA